jgi:hypothetical protein
MSRQRWGVLFVSFALGGCLYGSRPSLPLQEDGSTTSLVGDTHGPSRSPDAGAVTPDPRVDGTADAAMVPDATTDVQRETLPDGVCPMDDILGAGEAGDGGHPFDSGAAVDTSVPTDTGDGGDATDACTVGTARQEQNTGGRP